MSDLISRQDAIDALAKFVPYAICDESTESYTNGLTDAYNLILQLPSAQPTIYGYDIRHLELIAAVLQKENLPPEMVAEVLTDIGRIVAIVTDEFEEALKKAVEQCTTF